jgi:hypothetical protein
LIKVAYEPWSSGRWKRFTPLMGVLSAYRGRDAAIDAR